MRRVLFIENHDSFSWNVIDALPFAREQIEVMHADKAPAALSHVDAVVMGPGPTDPFRAGLIELVHEVARRKLPFLGVCLGHQALGLAFGAKLICSEPAHGKRALVHFKTSRLLPNIEGDFEAMRYHSLSLTSVRHPLSEVAHLSDQTVMAIEHESLPMAGLQFHPDSFGTPRGRELLSAFFHNSSKETPSHFTRPSQSVAFAQNLERINLSALRGRDDFALLGPGYDTHGSWTLLESLQPDEVSQPALWYAPAETVGTSAKRLTGRARAVDVHFDVAPPHLQTSLDEEKFLGGVRAIREHIAAGDVYQVNLTLRAQLSGCEDGAALLANLCQSTVPRFASWVKCRALGEWVSASPELLFETDSQWIHAEPMKGTAGPTQRQWLAESKKDKAELAMITDLLRDDLHHFCKPGTVKVTHERRFVELPYVVQSVADVEGEIREGVGLKDILTVMHPGGSVTGAPRQAALGCIAHLEASPRGAYCGTLGLEMNGKSRFALLIRTAEHLGTTWQYGVGSGITWDSNPEDELAEVRLKLGALRVIF